MVETAETTTYPLFSPPLFLLPPPTRVGGATGTQNAKHVLLLKEGILGKSINFSSVALGTLGGVFIFRFRATRDHVVVVSASAVPDVGVDACVCTALLASAGAGAGAGAVVAVTCAGSGVWWGCFVSVLHLLPRFPLSLRLSCCSNLFVQEGSMTFRHCCVAHCVITGCLGAVSTHELQRSRIAR